MTPPPDELRKSMGEQQYRVATDEEFEARGCDEVYAFLKGPNGFECLLTEPEDRNWHRDGKHVVNELNRLHEENEKLKAENLALQRNWVPERYQSREARGLPEITEVG